MYRFYVSEDDIADSNITITGRDVNHIKNVLRMTPGDRIIANDCMGTDYYCVIERILQDEVCLVIESSKKSEAELKTKLYLFQSLPKKDKMELIIQKAVELGVHEVVPIITKRCVVKLDDVNKQQKKTARWQAIAEAAAKQSARGIIPDVKMPMKFADALHYANNLEYTIIPFEHAEGMDYSREIMDKAADCRSVGIFIGPEGGFEREEIELAKQAGMKVVSLGNRILRTETAGMTVLSILMFKISD
ncbi:MAG: 16S rRNA (uracil(1498)-N(3))-methyltransferase [Lachnospiraceae bacterium]|nr:16S rRNA (uracil(1498)-N(3))-methyltransferase [Lachnospiraceae bacterium]